MRSSPLTLSSLSVHCFICSSCIRTVSIALQWLKQDFVGILIEAHREHSVEAVEDVFGCDGRDCKNEKLKFRGTEILRTL
jgi:hypothetical protein